MQPSSLVSLYLSRTIGDALSKSDEFGLTGSKMPSSSESSLLLGDAVKLLMAGLLLSKSESELQSESNIVSVVMISSPTLAPLTLFELLVARSSLML